MGKRIQGWMYLDTYLHIRSNQEVRVENCIRILEYNEVMVRLQTRDLIVEIWGTGLRVSDFSDSSVYVRGKISSVLMEEKRSRHENS